MKSVLQRCLFIAFVLSTLSFITSCSTYNKTTIKCSMCKGKGKLTACSFCNKGWLYCEHCDNGYAECGLCEKGYAICQFCKEGYEYCSNQSCNNGYVVTCKNCKQGRIKKKCGDIDIYEICPSCKGEYKKLCPECNGKYRKACRFCNTFYRKICPTCKGEKCKFCKGNYKQICPDCKGKFQEPCYVCNGAGRLRVNDLQLKE